jgi:hypothetical protein
LSHRDILPSVGVVFLRKNSVLNSADVRIESSSRCRGTYRIHHDHERLDILISYLLLESEDIFRLLWNSLFGIEGSLEEKMSYRQRLAYILKG